MSSEDQTSDNATDPEDRRSFLARTSSVAMVGGLAAGYGAFGVMLGRYLYPSSPLPRGWLYVARTADLEGGKSLTFDGPDGTSVVVGKRDDGEYFALSSICPHLGCRVHWEPQNTRFFCPCHNGVFDPLGNPVSGPPAQDNQPLTTFPVKVENDLVFVEVPLGENLEHEGDGHV